MHIAICDSDECFCSLLEAWIEEYSVKNYITVSIEIFYSSEHLLTAMSRDEWYDLVFISLTPPSHEGLSAGKYIREKLCNDRTNIVYISNTNSILRALFDSRPINFHVKPLNKIDIYKDIDTAMRLSGLISPTFKFKYNGTVRGVGYTDIMYFSMEQKQVLLNTQKKKYLFRGNLNEVNKHLPGRFFCRCHKSFIINVNFIESNTSNYLKLANGEEIPIGRKFRENVKVVHY